ncbi:hypothetical protein [Yoonia sp. SS1-5]|uniref:Uncharacterized protein n=1 Tax=Yoonia rhodophyticola TaxID=3137370 RepID=A0AAN0NKS8_9RHOB
MICTVILVVWTGGQAAAENEILQFFPSVPIHEDDRLTGHFEATVQGCNVELTETSEPFVTVSRFDVQSYETDPGRLSWPYVKQLSTRYNVAWFKRDGEIESSMEELNIKLRQLRVSWSDRRTLSPDEVRAKSMELENWLSEIRSGGQGQFAQRNHTARHLSDDERFLVSVSINTALVMPVRVSDMSSLAHAMYRHGLTCHRN